MVENIVTTAKSSLKVKILAEKGEGLHRTLHRLKMLKALPPIIIYHGGSEELFEKSFLSSEYSAIMENIKIYEDFKLSDTIKLPQRPTTFDFGGIKRNTLFVTSRHSVYAINMQQKKDEEK
jgi:hypothetical protein